MTWYSNKQCKQNSKEKKQKCSILFHSSKNYGKIELIKLLKY